MGSSVKDLDVLVSKALSVENSVDICPLGRWDGSGEPFRVVACRLRRMFLDHGSCLGSRIFEVGPVDKVKVWVGTYLM